MPFLKSPLIPYPQVNRFVFLQKEDVHQEKMKHPPSGQPIWALVPALLLFPSLVFHSSFPPCYSNCASCLTNLWGVCFVLFCWSSTCALLLSRKRFFQTTPWTAPFLSTKPLSKHPATERLFDRKELSATPTPSCCPALASPPHTWK